MADINQWRRKIQPVRSRTPILSGEHDDMESENLHSFAPSSKKSRPKLSTYLPHYIPSSGQSKHLPFLDNNIGLVDSPSFSTDVWKEDYESDFDQVMDSIMRMLMAEPYRPLDICHNTSILMIFEKYRAIRDRNAILIEKLGQEVEARYSAQEEFESASKKWLQEKEEYRAEVKRLELVIAKGKAGLAGVAQARQDSVLRRSHKQPASAAREDHKETVFEFLERTRTEDEAAKRAQRALFRNRPVSPSHRMAALSHKISTTGASDNLLGTSPSNFEEPTTLSEASYFETMSSQPSLLDPLDQDNVQDRSTDAGPTHDSSASADLDHSEYQASGSSSNTMLGMKTKQPVNNSVGYKMNVLSFKVSTVSLNGFSTTPRSRRRPESLRFDQERRFSFELGDDTATLHQPFQPTQSPLQRSVSVSYLDQRAGCLSSHRGLGNLAISNPLSTPIMVSPPVLESPRLSKIPSPVFDASLARPRREDSASSFLTAIRAPHTGEDLSRTTSRSSNLDDGRQSSRGSFRDDGTLAAIQRPNEFETGIRGSSMVNPAVNVTSSPTAQISTAQLSPPHYTSHMRGESTINASPPLKPFAPDGRLGER